MNRLADALWRLPATLFAAVILLATLALAGGWFALVLIVLGEVAKRQ